MIPKKQAATSFGEYLLQLTFAYLLELLAFRLEVIFARSKPEYCLPVGNQSTFHVPAYRDS